MAPPKKLVAVQHRVRRMHPLAAPMSRELRRIAAAGPDEIRAFQEGRLRAMTRWAAVASPFYRQWFRREKVDPREIRTLDDLRRLPVLRRNDLMDRPETFRAYPARAMWEAHSSGTSGRAVTVYRTPGSSVYEMRVLERQWSWFGLPRALRRVTLGGSDFAADRPGNPTEIVPGARQLLVSSYRLTPDDLPRSCGTSAGSVPTRSTAGRRASVCSRNCCTSRGSNSRSAPSSRPPRRCGPPSAPDPRGLPRPDRRSLRSDGARRDGGHVRGGHDAHLSRLRHRRTRTRPRCPGQMGDHRNTLAQLGFPDLPLPDGRSGRTGTGRRVRVRPGIPHPRSARRSVEDAFTAADGRPLPLPSTVIDDVTGVREAQIAQLAPGRFEIRMVPGVGFDAERVEQQYRRNVERLFGPGQELRVVTLDAVPRTASGKLKTAVVEGGGDRAVPAAVAEAFAGYRLGPGE